MMDVAPLKKSLAFKAPAWPPDSSTLPDFSTFKERSLAHISGA